MNFIPFYLFKLNFVTRNNNATGHTLLLEGLEGQFGKNTREWKKQNLVIKI